MQDLHSRETRGGAGQPSPAEYLFRDREELPRWLAACTPSGRVPVQDLMRSRMVYDPGAGMDGSPIRVFNTAHAAHVFVCVDYGFSKSRIDQALSDRAFFGYHLLCEQEVSARDLVPHSPVCHLTREELTEVRKRYAEASVTMKNAFGLLKVYERDAILTDDHGAVRFAVLYLGADAIAAYDVLFGNSQTAPFACVVDAYGFDGSYDHFAGGSLMEKIAQRTDRYPRYLLCAAHCQGWEGYAKLKTVGGSRHRFLWKKEN